jgi:hypothetical protein
MIWTMACTTPQLKVTLGKPTVLAESQPGERRWGYHQFPKLSWLPRTRAHSTRPMLLTYNSCGDNDLEYGAVSPAFTSRDMGVTWTPHLPESRGSDSFGAKLAVSHSPISEIHDGDMLCTPFPPGRSPELLPADVLEHRAVAEFYCYAPRRLYRMSDMPAEIETYHQTISALRWSSSDQQWHEVEIAWPHDRMLMRVFAGSSWVRSSFEQKLVRLEGELFNSDYKSYYQHADGTYPGNMESLCMVSKDNGRSFQRRSVIAADAAGDHMFGEGDLEVNSEGHLLSVIRRTDHEQKSMVINCSTDAGHTWSPPVPMAADNGFAGFGHFGVLPQLHLMGNNILAVSFGRPGVWLSFSHDGTGHAGTWCEPIPVISGAADDVTRDTCGYTNLLPLDDHSFLLAYSDFQHINALGERCKSIKVVPVEARRRS